MHNEAFVFWLLFSIGWLLLESIIIAGMAQSLLDDTDG
jgi:hypothetical protein